ncbi:DUF443 family protein [Staphylococcus aureus]|nr:DUF443 family protein [Staphylococcus aureus]
MVNIINNWLVLFIPLLNWLTPKRYIKISQEELENLNTFKPAKNNAFWPALGSSVLFSVTFRKYMPLFNVRLEKTIVIAIFFVVFLGILFFYLNLNRRLALSVFTMNKEKSQKMILLPNLKHFFFIIFAYLYFGGFSFFHFICPDNYRCSKYNYIYLLGCSNYVFLFYKHCSHWH